MNSGSSDHELEDYPTDRGATEPADTKSSHRISRLESSGELSDTAPSSTNTPAAAPKSPRPESPVTYPLRVILNTLWTAFLLWSYGVRDALAFRTVWAVVKQSPDIRRRTGQCLAFNGGIFLGSYFLYEQLVNPLIQHLLISEQPNMTENVTFVLRFINLVLSALYYLLWLYPIYIISFLLNADWYEDIAKQANRHIRKSDASSGAGFERVVRAIGGEIYRNILYGSYLITAFVCYLVPLVGPLLNFTCLSWLYSLYCFEYRWIVAGEDLRRRLKHFELHYVYMAGFGTPFTICCYFFPYLVSYGMFALMFPLFIIMAAHAVPVRHGDARGPTQLPARLHVFHYAKWINMVFIELLPGVASIVGNVAGSSGRTTPWANSYPPS